MFAQGGLILLWVLFGGGFYDSTYFQELEGLEGKVFCMDNRHAYLQQQILRTKDLEDQVLWSCVWLGVRVVREREAHT